MRIVPTTRTVAAALASAALLTTSALGTTHTSQAAAPAPAASKADARRVPTGALVSGMPVSRQNTSPGAGKTAGYECTAGLPAKKGGNYYMIVAGHCGKRGETIYTAWNKGKRTPIGKITGVSATYDIAAVRVTRKVAESVWTTQRGTNRLTPITGVANSVAGRKVCQHGYRSGTVCGITVQPITSKQKVAGLVYGKAARGTVGSRPGDSGGLVTNSNGAAIGIISEATDDGQWVAWVPATLALKNWGLSPL